MYLAHSFTSNQKKQVSGEPLVLVVEDDGDNLVLIGYALESFGCRCICQAETSMTVLVAKKYQPDLILLDIFLPGVSGLDVLGDLKLEPLTRDIPVVAVTALAGAEERSHFLRAGFNEYISKPFMIHDLEVVVNRLLNRNPEPFSAFEMS